MSARWLRVCLSLSGGLSREGFFFSFSIVVVMSVGGPTSTMFVLRCRRRRHHRHCHWCSMLCHPGDIPMAMTYSIFFHEHWAHIIILFSTCYCVFNEPIKRIQIPKKKINSIRVCCAVSMKWNCSLYIFLSHTLFASLVRSPTPTQATNMHSIALDGCHSVIHRMLRMRCINFCINISDDWNLYTYKYFALLSMSKFEILSVFVSALASNEQRTQLWYDWG